MKGKPGRKGARLVDTDDQLENLVTEVIGTLPGEYKDGAWYRLFGGWMSIWEKMLAPVRWMTAEEESRSSAAGFYSHANQIAVRKGYDEETVKEILVHEFTHNWQYKGEKFDFPEHQDNASARQFFDGKLVIEGHAVWSDHQYRFDSGMGPSYTPSDSRPWNEYKTGYLLMESIEKAIGERGLYAWLKEGVDSTEPDVRSRLPELNWPFDLQTALRAFNLLEPAKAGSFSSFDIIEEGNTDPPDSDEE